MMAVETSVALHAYHPGPVSRWRVPVVTKILRSSATCAGLGSWLQEVAPFLVTWERPYVRNVQALLHLNDLCLCQSVKGFSCCLSVSKMYSFVLIVRLRVW